MFAVVLVTNLFITTISKGLQNFSETLIQNITLQENLERLQ